MRTFSKIHNVLFLCPMCSTSHTKTVIVLLVTLCMGFTGFAQTDAPVKIKATFKLPVDSISGKVTYSGIDTASGDKDELYARALVMIGNMFTAKDDMIHEANKADGRIVVKASTPMRLNTIPVGNHTTFILTLELKDGKYKYTMNTFRWVSANSLDFDNPGVTWTDVFPNEYETLKHTLDEKMKTLETEFKKGMHKKTDW